MSSDLQKNFEKIEENYEKMLSGNSNLEDFWNILFPFVNELLNGQNYKTQREKIGKVDIDSLGRLVVNLRDKKQRYNYRYSCKACDLLG